MPPDLNVHVGVCGWVEAHDGSTLLMVQRGGVGRFASDGHGTWSVPGGWLDFGESPECAAEREVLEETGVMVKATERMGFVSAMSDDGKFQIVTLFVRCVWLGGTPTITEPDKCPAVAWQPMAGLDELPLFAPLRAWRERLNDGQADG